MSVKLIYVCRPCDRDAPPGSPAQLAGQRLTHACGSAIASRPDCDLIVREVDCLNGCPQPCNVSLRGARLPTLRFSQVVTDDIPALLDLALRYWTPDRRSDIQESIRDTLRAKLTAYIPPVLIVPAPSVQT